MATYWELLKDPRWQRKRLEVMERENFTCQDCDATDKTLNVHHSYYAKGKKPWEYPTESLKCLCENCHTTIERVTDEARRSLNGMWPAGRERMLGYLRVLAFMDGGPQVVPCESMYVAISIGQFFEVDYRTVLAFVGIDGMLDVGIIWSLMMDRHAPRRVETDFCDAEEAQPQ